MWTTWSKKDVSILSIMWANTSPIKDQYSMLLLSCRRQGPIPTAGFEFIHFHVGTIKSSCPFKINSPFIHLREESKIKTTQHKRCNILCGGTANILVSLLPKMNAQLWYAAMLRQTWFFSTIAYFLDLAIVSIFVGIGPKFFGLGLVAWLSWAVVNCVAYLAYIPNDELFHKERYSVLVFATGCAMLVALETPLVIRLLCIDYFYA